MEVDEYTTSASSPYPVPSPYSVDLCGLDWRLEGVPVGIKDDFMFVAGHRSVKKGRPEAASSHARVGGVVSLAFDHTAPQHPSASCRCNFADMMTFILFLPAFAVRVDTE